MLGIKVDIASKVGEMESFKCHWSDLFDKDEKLSLERGLNVTGLLSIALGLWMNISLLLTYFGLDRSYKNLLNFTVIASVRRMMPFVANLSMFRPESESDHMCCQFFAFLETFMAVYEVEAVTHVCIERYVLAKYVTNGWSMQKYQYILFQGLCFFFASLYSFPPLFGIGRYAYDFTCSSCTFDMILSSTWERYVVVAIFMLRSMKPTIVILAMLIWAQILERKFMFSEETQKQKKFTQNIITITILNLICWFPIALIRGCAVFSQLFNTDPIVITSDVYIKWAMWIHWVSPALTTLALFMNDRRIRESMLYVNSTNNAVEDAKGK